MKIVSAKDIRMLDQWAVRQRHIPELILMENAGRAVAEHALAYLEPGKNQVVVVAGKGNNGGDGLVAARHLHQRGADVRLFLLHTPEDFSASAAENWAFIEATGLRWYVLKDKNSFYPLKLCLETAAVAVDAMLGSGAHGPLEGNYLAAAQSLNAGAAPILSVDMPTGVDGDTGQAAEGAIKARETVTFAYGKQGLFIYPGRELAGKVAVEDISLPVEGQELLENPTIWVDESYARGLLPEVKTDSFKGSFGHVLSVAGSRGMMGAAFLAARSALRSGAGLVTSAVPDSLADGFDLAFAEGMTLALPEEEGTLAPSAAEELFLAAEKKSVILFGPGMPQKKGLTSLLRELLPAVKKPVVVDAGGLWALAQDKAMAGVKSGPLILTPHPGELALLLGSTAETVQKDRVNAVRKAARDFGAVVILKGASSLVADENGSLFINSTGSPALATAGSGDVLAGAVAAWIAQGLEPLEAAVLATYLHGLAGGLLREKMGLRGGLSGEVAELLPLALKELSRS
ncbi:MAG: NAD(P)H-hydrate dehydratase [Peptococcaceae bacterium]|nr:NAD(P)H-hydrate dehydratase [Peptococcaceae bacterium]